MRTATGRRAAPVAVLAMLLGACGVPTEESPRPVTPSGRLPVASPPVATATPRPGSLTETLYLVRDGMLVAVSRSAIQPRPIDDQLSDLQAGPTQPEREAGLSSALTGLAIDPQVRLRTGEAAVDVGSQPDDAGRNDQILAYGQIVCTLVSRPDVDAVAFYQNGERLGVPRADGSLVQGTLTCTDYASLVTRP